MPPLEYLRSSGGQMRDQAIHFFDLLRFLTGDEVTTVAAMGDALALAEIAEFDDVDTSILMLRMRGGALAQLDNTSAPATATMSALACLARMACWSPAVRQRAASRCGRESAAFSPASTRLVQPRRGVVLRASGCFCPLARRRRGGGPAGAAGRPAGAGYRQLHVLAAAGTICQRRTTGVKKAPYAVGIRGRFIALFVKYHANLPPHFIHHAQVFQYPGQRRIGESVSP